MFYNIQTNLISLKFILNVLVLYLFLFSLQKIIYLLFERVLDRLPAKY